MYVHWTNQDLILRNKLAYNQINKLNYTQQQPDPYSLIK